MITSALELTHAPSNLGSMEWVGRQHPERPQVESLIRTVFRERYGADVHHFYDVLIGLRDATGRWTSALGFSGLSNRQAFLEQYLDSPVDGLIQKQIDNTGRKRIIRRSDIVEVGNLAALEPGRARDLILYMTRYLYLSQFRWVVFTATQELANSFSRLRFSPVSLGLADQGRLVEQQADWGSYYATQPRVMFGDIGSAYAKLQSHA